MQAGAALVKQWAEKPADLLRTDATTGERYLHVPMTAAPALAEVASALGKLLASLRGEAT